MRILLLYLLLCGCFVAAAQEVPLLHPQQSGSSASLRGLSVLSDQVVWASGSGGQFLRTLNGGETWQKGQVAGADSLDFRDVHAFSESEALIVSAGQPARIYRTSNGGKNWQMVFEDATGQAFFDAVAFQNKTDGLLMSDPVGGTFLLYRTLDGGWTWERVRKNKLPKAVEGEAGFAASGTGLVMMPGLALFGTGGPVVRVFRSTDGGKQWSAHPTPLLPESRSTGIYSIAMKDSLQGVAVGGDYTRPDAKTNHLLLTEDGGKSWLKIDQSGLGGYRSGIAYVPGTSNTYVAVGTNGMDISFKGGKSWQPLSRKGMHAIRFAPSGKTGWASGANGQLIKFVFQ